MGNDEIFRAGGDVMYSHSRQKTQQTSNKQYLFADSTSYENAFSNAIDRSHNLTGNFRMQWHVDSLNTLDLRPSFMLSVNDSDKASWSRLFAGDANRTAVNSSDNLLTSSGTSYDIGGKVVYNHKFRNRPGRLVLHAADLQIQQHKRGRDHIFNQQIFPSTRPGRDTRPIHRQPSVEQPSGRASDVDGAYRRHQ